MIKLLQNSIILTSEDYLPVIYQLIQPKQYIIQEEYPIYYLQSSVGQSKIFDNKQIKKLNIKQISAKGDTNIKKRILEFKAGLITKEELIKGLTEKDGLWYYKDHVVFCNCLLGEPCEYDNDSDTVSKLDMYVQIYGFNVLQQLVPVITDNEKQQQSIQSDMELKLQNVFSYPKFAKANKKELIQYITNISILVFYKFYYDKFNINYSDSVYSQLKAFVRQNVSNMIKSANLDDIVEQFNKIVEQVFYKKMIEDDEPIEEEEDETGQKQQERDAEESS